MSISKQAIFETVRTRLITLFYKPGEILNEMALAQEFACSRTPIREALLSLVGTGLATRTPGIGIQASTIDMQQVRECFEMKMHLEGLAASLAAKRATPDEVDRLFTILATIDTYDTEIDYEAYLTQDRKFHETVLMMANNLMLHNTLNNTIAHTSRFMEYIHYKVKDRTWFHSSLLDIAKAIQAKDPVQAEHSAKHHASAFLIEMSESFFNRSW